MVMETVKVTAKARAAAVAHLFAPRNQHSATKKHKKHKKHK
jgi:hypothetical protein